MTYYRRVRTGPAYFFTVVSHHRRPILCHDTIRHALRIAIENLRIIRPFSIDAWVLLPDHVHHQTFGLPFSPDIALDPSVRNDSARKYRESTIWQRRFWEHQIRDERDFERHLDYIHFNPMKHGHVQCVADWPYSTFHRYVRNGVYARDWCGGNVEDVEGE